MKNILLVVLTVFAISTITFAQPSHPRKVTKEDPIAIGLKTKKIAFLSTELNLTTAEAKKFWPVYNEYAAKMHNIHLKGRKLKKKLKRFEELSTEEAYKTTENVLKLEGEKTVLKKEYLEKFSKLLGKKKGAKVFYVEIKFRRELLRKIKSGKGNFPPLPPIID